MMATETKNKISSGVKPTFWIHFAITIFLMFFFRFLPAPAPITPYGMSIIGIFFGIIYAWSTTSLIWPSLLSLLALGLTNYGATSKVFIAAFGNEMWVLMLLGFIMFGAAMDANVTDWIAVKLVTMKLTKGRPWVLVAVTFYGILFLSSVMNGLLLCIFLLAVFTDLFKKFGYGIGDRFTNMFIVGMMMATAMGCSIFPFKGWPLAPLGTVRKASGLEIETLPFMILVISFICVTMAAYILVMKLVKCDVSKLINVDFDELEASIAGGLSPRQKAICFAIIANVVLCVCISIFGGPTGWHAMVSQCGIYGVILLTLVAMLVIHIEGKPLLNVSMASHFIPWDMVFLYASAMLVSTLLTTEETGVAPFMMKALMPIFNGTGEYVFLLLIAAATLVLTNIGNNLVVVFTMLSVVNMMLQQGVVFNAPIAVIMITVLGLMGFALPAASIYGAMIHGSELTTAKSAFTYGCVSIVVTVVVSAVFFIPVGQLLF